MEQWDNPYLQRPDPFKEHRENIKQLAAENPNAFEIDKLAYEWFIKNEHGIRMWEIIVERFMLKSLIDPRIPHADKMALYWEGYKDFPRHLYAAAIEHRKRIESN